MKTRNTWTRLLVPLLSVGLIAAACGGEDKLAAPDTSAADVAAEPEAEVDTAAAEAAVAQAEAEADVVPAEAEVDAAEAEAEVPASEAGAAVAQAETEVAEAEPEAEVDASEPESAVAEAEAEAEVAQAATVPVLIDVESWLSPDGSRLAYTDSQARLFVAEPDGSNPRQVADFAAIYELHCAAEIVRSVIWSDDGTRLMFHDRDGLLYTAHDDGTNITQVTSDPVAIELGGDGPAVTCTAAMWVPGSTKIIYEKTDADWVRHLYSVNVDGSSRLQIAEDIFSWLFAPNGSKIVYTTYDDDYNTFLADADGSNPVRIIEGGFFLDPYSSWSPDGSKVAYVAGGSLHIRDADGSNHVTIATILGETYEFGIAWRWSPDGTMISYRLEDEVDSWSSHFTDWYVANADGTNRVLLARSDAINFDQPIGTLQPIFNYDDMFEWSSDGTELIYIMRMWEIGDGSAGPISDEVHSVNADGTNNTFDQP